ncbi:MAG: sodium/glutamate symporter [Gammaproteobacteria bacterium]|nr:MAG: sodium/glutamate symporter [Gammaproteobacteria bacterium]RKZ95192.1 MAG: sodium/glutamate symporter [Gammaproteobacteria bacterium]RKZ95651.1 MAG: sodium/glutamate symporter [Gammaproteobacteria bacterium]
MSLDFGPTQTLGFAILILYIGIFLIAHQRFLRENNIPAPVVGGFLFALIASLLLGQFNIRFGFDMAMKEPMMLAFFSCVGLGADMRMLSTGGKQLLLFIIACLLYLIIQDGIGLMTAISLDLHPLVGLLSGSITLSGGHATGAAYAQQFHDSSNIAGAMELAMAVATFGLILGGIIGGPVAGRLIKKHNIPLPDKVDNEHGTALQYGDNVSEPVNEDNFLLSFFYILICIIFGKIISVWFAEHIITLPDIFWAMFVGVVIRNTTVHEKLPSAHQPSVDLVGNIALALFLVMALMSLNLWGMISMAGPLLILLSTQLIGMVIFASYITWHIMGRNYNAAIIAGGHCGFGLGATPTAVANMSALTKRFGPAPQAFIVVPLMGAFFIDLLNAIVIQIYLTLPVFGLS